MKIYEVTFIEYTNSMKNTVKDEKGNYLDVSEPCLITEDSIARISSFGKGIRELKYIGTLATNLQ